MDDDINLLSPEFIGDYLMTSEVVEEIQIDDELTGVFFRAKKDIYNFINYPYRLVCYPRGKREPVLMINLEKSPAGYFWGATSVSSHYNLGPAEGEIDYELFRKKAVEMIARVKKMDEETEEIYSSLEDCCLPDDFVESDSLEELIRFFKMLGISLPEIMPVRRKGRRKYLRKKK